MTDAPATPRPLWDELMLEAAGDYPDHVCVLMQTAAAVLEKHDARVAELLGYNNDEMQKRRDMQRERDGWRDIVTRLVTRDPIEATGTAPVWALMEAVRDVLDGHDGMDVSLHAAVPGSYNMAIARMRAKLIGMTGYKNDLVLVPVAAMKWLFGEGPDDKGCPPVDQGAFWWRTVFRRMTGWKS